MKGTQISHWIVEDKLGEGGMGDVWLARHALINRKVAIKVMAQPLVADQKFQERFVQEASAQARLQHPHIVGVSDFFSANGIYYLVMPYIEGQSLEERITAAAGPLPLPEALKIACEVLPALDYAHQQLIIHRDVKPSNILLDRSGHAYLVDFGIALMIGQERKTKTGTTVGTAFYMSPDQISNTKKVDHRTDVYSFGCVLYELLTGRPPFIAGPEDGDIDFTVKYHHVKTEPQPLRQLNPQIPEKIEAVVMKSLAKNPDERFVSCGAFARALAEAEEKLLSAEKIIFCPHCQQQNQVEDAATLAETKCGKCSKMLLGETAKLPAVSASNISSWKIAAAVLGLLMLISFGSCISVNEKLRQAQSSSQGYSADLRSEQTRNLELESRSSQLQQSLNSEKDTRRKLAENWPLTITDIKLRNENGKGEALSGYTESFSSSDAHYIYYYLTLQNNLVGIDSINGEIGVKYIKPDNSLIHNESSPPGFSQKQKVEISVDSTTSQISWGRGTQTGGGFISGTHRIEFWWQGKLIGAKNFVIY